jgi:hypothetical protein
MAGGHKASVPHPLRERILAFYRHYCPEKTASHVDFLLDKYAGHEDEVLEILREKYGPEPKNREAYSDDLSRISAVLQSPQAASYLADQFRGQEAALRHSLVDRYGAEPLPPRGAGSRSPPSSSRSPLGAAAAELQSDALERALDERRGQFQRDMALVKQQEEQRKTLETLQAVTDAKLELQRQEVELQQLRLAVSSAKAQRVASEAAHDEEIKRAAQQLTRAKVRLMTLRSTADPHKVSASRLEAVVSETSSIEGDMRQAVQYCRCLAEAVRRHLRMHPLSPMHATLRDADPAMCARLEH